MPRSCYITSNASCRGKQTELRKTGNEFELRVRERKALPKALKNAQGFFKNTRQALGSWPVTKPWLNKTDIEDLDKQVYFVLKNEFETFLIKQH